MYLLSITHREPAMTDLIYILWNLSIILESLPISSSGHLQLIARYLSRKNTISLTLDTATEHMMHIPNALIIVLILLRYLPYSLPSLPPYLIAIAIVNGITGIAYITLKKRIAQLPLAFGFAVSAATLLSLYWAPSSSDIAVSYGTALVLGIAQSCALLPGVSRMAMTTVVGIWIGLHPGVSFLFSLACELGLIGIAVVAAHNKNNELSLSRKQLIFITLSTVVSYAALELSRYSFVSGSAALFGWYLVGVSTYAAISSADNQSRHLSNY